MGEVFHQKLTQPNILQNSPRGSCSSRRRSSVSRQCFSLRDWCWYIFFCLKREEGRELATRFDWRERTSLVGLGLIRGRAGLVVVVSGKLQALCTSLSCLPSWISAERYGSEKESDASPSRLDPSLPFLLFSSSSWVDSRFFSFSRRMRLEAQTRNVDSEICFRVSRTERNMNQQTFPALREGDEEEEGNSKREEMLSTTTTAS